MNTFTDIKQAGIEQVKNWLDERLTPAKAKQAKRLADQYYAKSIARELAESPFEDMYGALLCLWNCIHQRTPGTPIVRAYNPNHEEHRWHSTHTVIEILSDDMPFLVSSISMELTRRELNIHKLTHPVIKVRRTKSGKLQEILEPGSEHPEAIAEALMRIEIDHQPDSEAMQEIIRAIEEILTDVRRTVEDWPNMMQILEQAIGYCASTPLPVDKDELEESLAFLNWVSQDNFLFLGYRYYELHQDDEGHLLRIRDNTGLGTFRDEVRQSHHEIRLSPRMVELAQAPNLLVITKSTSRSTVQRPAHLDYLGIKHFNDQGQVIGEWRFFGLYSSQAYSTPIEEVPLLRQKAASLWEKSGLTTDCHSGKALRHIINHYPRDEMLQASPEQLQSCIFGILECQERRQLRVFVRPDLYGRFITALVYVPRDRYNTEMRLKMQEILLDEFSGHSAEFNVHLSEQLLAQIQFTIHSSKVDEIHCDPTQIEARMTAAMLSWSDNLHFALVERQGEAQGNRLNRRYGHAFPAAYREEVSPRRAVADILRLESLSETHPLTTYLYRPVEDFDSLYFRVMGRGELMALSDVLPILEQMGVKVLSARPYALKPSDCERSWVLDFRIATNRGFDPDDRHIREQFQESFVRTYRGDIENDGFNALVIAAGLSWRQVSLLRALCKYLLQLGLPFSQSYMQETLANNAPIATMLVELFENRFAPSYEGDRQESTQSLIERIEAALEEVANLDEDRILRHFLSLIQAMLRSNYFQQDGAGQNKGYLSFKFSPERIPAAPQPRPMYEIFVYAPWMEGVHMRGGKVARGGLRWSDRREDFRTEVLGLVKAQMVKNAVIVPVGAKGGFVCKQLPSEGDRETIQNEVIRCYRTLISGMLDITDNLVAGELVAPQSVVRHDEDDPYLVVAADKGTATFSDIANEISQSYGFWMGDAFASGGSQGYDHKKMGITARGGWESVKRLFREQGLDTQSQEFRVVGIGDMGGDVFGNGMLLSEHIQLVAAFNHMHIFIDPNPDAAKSFAERKRLFETPRTTWDDYDKKLLSKGGAIYPRSAKSIKLSSEARKALGISASKLTPNELIQAILRAPVDLLWNGGIGTYVKASTETHDQVGDRANDGLRIDATELGVKVVGEGGNLGLTQRARIEFARRGGLINTDAIDNSGGVDSSDHEVNIKILLDAVVANGDMTTKQRNQLLASMTDEVASLVLRHNFLQSHILSLCVEQAPSLLNDHRHLINTLEKEGRLKRKLESLPDDASLKELAKNSQGLARPEIAVLLAYSKLRLFDELLKQKVADDPYLQRVLPEYFPKPLRERFVEELHAHPLRAEIITTHITNQLGNRMGSTFCHYVEHEAHCRALDTVRAYTAAKEILGVEALWSAMEQLGMSVDDAQQRALYIGIQDILEKATLWLLRNHGDALDIDTLIQRYRPNLEALAPRLPELLGDAGLAVWDARVGKLTEQGIPMELARALVALRYQCRALDIVSVALQLEQPAAAAAEAYFALDGTLELYWLRDQVRQLPEADLWQRKARSALATELDKLLGSACAKLLANTDGSAPLAERLAQWQAQNQTTLARCRQTLADIRSGGEQNLAMLSVAVRELSGLAA